MLISSGPGWGIDPDAAQRCFRFYRVGVPLNGVQTSSRTAPMPNPSTGGLLLIHNLQILT